MSKLASFALGLVRRQAFLEARGGGTPFQEANGDVPLDEVAFSRLE